MNPLKINYPQVLLLALCLVGCEPFADPESEFKFSEDLILNTDFIYDAEARNISIDYLLSDAATQEPYSLVQADGPVIANWYDVKVELDRVDTGRLKGVLPLRGFNLGELEISTKLLSSVIQEISVLDIANVPSLLEGAYQDTEIMRIFWSPTSTPSINSSYLEDKTIEVIIRGVKCGENQTDYTPGRMKLDANSVYTSENTITTTVSYQTVLDLLRDSSASTGEECELDMSIVSTQELVMQATGTNNDSRVSIMVPSNFANTVSDTHTFTFYSQTVTFTLNL